MLRSVALGIVVALSASLLAIDRLHAQVRVDFDGDGYADLAVGVPEEDVGDLPDAGAVNVLYGSQAGLTAARSSIFTQAVAGVPGYAQEGAEFGRALATGDFNGDGFTDLAVGVPGHHMPRLPGSGLVVIFHGGAGGLAPARSTFLTWLHSLARFSRFGCALAVGDIDRDGFDDLAAGAPDTWKDLEGTPGTGHGDVLVWYGGRFGMRDLERWHQGAYGLRERWEYRDQFGSALVMGDFDGDGYADLAVGAPGEETVGYASIGAVSVLYGSVTGLLPGGNQVWTQLNDGAEGDAQDGDRYGEVLGRGDFDGDGRDELLVGAPGGGSVHVIYGTTTGLTADYTQSLGALLPGLVTADFDADGVEDLVLRGRGARERLQIHLGEAFVGLHTNSFHPVTEYLMPGLWTNDFSQQRTAQAGYALAADEFCGAGQPDLAVGIPRYSIFYQHGVLYIREAGAVAVFEHFELQRLLAGAGSPLSETPIIQWTSHLDRFEGGYGLFLHEIGGLAEPDDHFGAVLAR